MFEVFMSIVMQSRKILWYFGNQVNSDPNNGFGYFLKYFQRIRRGIDKGYSQGTPATLVVGVYFSYRQIILMLIIALAIWYNTTKSIIYL